MRGASEAEIIAWLEARTDRRIDTACAHVFLARETAWKIKRHVDLGYADFSTADRRLWALDRELDFNRATAPDIYRAVRPITREADGSLALAGRGEAVEYVLEMRRFDERQVLSARPQSVDGDMAEALGRAIAGFHAAAPLRPAGGLSAVAFTVGSNAQLLRETCEGLDQDRVEQMIALTEAELERQSPLLARRSAEGFARRATATCTSATSWWRTGGRSCSTASNSTTCCPTSTSSTTSPSCSWTWISAAAATPRSARSRHGSTRRPAASPRRSGRGWRRCR